MIMWHPNRRIEFAEELLDIGRSSYLSDVALSTVRLDYNVAFIPVAAQRWARAVSMVMT